ncbi:hypothetical protein SAMN05421748_13174 [Paractinoplanes atraurantiacus]|uniref:Uncharacterized protein n=1 Tax=Paractinoplanes atraurantiacus TaxID=1036182 RepID=A0A285K3W5_9ACTN|nr:hypothetical protein SAMN05421748_13174 [Actinoplanes atraurantiacus]
MARVFEEWANLPSADTDLAVPPFSFLYATTAALAASIAVAAATTHYLRARRATRSTRSARPTSLTARSR